MIKYAVKYIKNTFVPLKCPDNVNLDDGVLILARTEKGEEALKAFLVNKDVAKHFEASNKTPAPFEFIRIMTQEDMMVLEELKKEEVTSFFKCKDLVKKHNLNMNLVQCRITFDKRKISFYYTAPERVDFRELLKDLTQVFKRMRIDLRHIGVRDESSIMDGTGICGKPFCCSSYLRKFESINVKLAKDQGMPIAPSKISGTCGRLMCCLKNEEDTYEELNRKLPGVGDYVQTADGLHGEVQNVNVLRQLVKVLVEVGDEKELKEYEADTLQFKRRRGKKGGQELSKEEQKELEKLEEIEEKEEAEERAEKRAEQRQDRREQRTDGENRGDNRGENRRRDGRRDDNRRNNNRGENQNRNDNRGENRNNENRGDNRRDNNRDTRRDNNRGDRRRENRPQNRPEQVRENSDAQGAEQSGSQGQAPRDNSFRRRPRHGGRRDGNNGNNGNGRKPENTNEG